MTLDNSQIAKMLHTMILIREFDERAIQLRVAGKIYGAVHPYVGQEAVAVGVCSTLTVSDRVTSTHRGHGHCIAKGADIRRMMAELFGRVDGYCKGKGGSMHIADFAVGMLGANGIVGGGLPIACGAALAAQLEGTGRRHRVLLWRRRGRRGRVPRGAQYRDGVEAAHRLRL
jgi:pyruvate dehydrogenase E1 component alpha subunit